MDGAVNELGVVHSFLIVLYWW